MRSPLRFAVAGCAVAAVVLAAYLAAWAHLDRLEGRRSDFTSRYLSASLLRSGGGTEAYDQARIIAAHRALLPPGDGFGLQRMDSPPAVPVLALPLTLLDVDTAFRVWSATQLLLLLAAALVAARAAPWPQAPTGTGRLLRAAAVGIALAGVGVCVTLVEGQWDGIPALGLAATYAAWRRGRRGWAGGWLGATAMLAKPHLALGLAAFALARRDRRLAAGLVGGGAAALGFGVAGVSLHGLGGWLAALTDTYQTNLAWEMGMRGLVASWLGQGAVASALAATGTVAALTGAAALGWATRGRPDLLEPALAGAAALSLVAAPHLLAHDAAVLVPAVVWMLAWAARSDAVAGRAAGTATTLRVAGVWLLVNLGDLLDFDNGRPAPPGRLLPVALLLAAALCAVCVHRAAAPLRATGARAAVLPV